MFFQHTGSYQKVTKLNILKKCYIFIVWLQDFETLLLIIIFFSE